MKNRKNTALLLSSFARPALLGQETQWNQIPGYPTSCLGGIAWGFPDEDWPSYHGEDLVPVFTLRVDELPYCPENLEDVALLQVFVAQDDSMLDEDKGSCVVRTYSTLSGLAPLSPVYGSWFDFIQISWQKVTDYPLLSHISVQNLDDSTKRQIEAALTKKAKQFKNHYGMKVGGWPHLIQGAYFLKLGGPEFILQIDQSEIYTFCDSGIGFLSRSPKGWGMHWETM